MKILLILLISIFMLSSMLHGQEQNITKDLFDVKTSFERANDILKVQDELNLDYKIGIKQKLDSVDTYEYDYLTGVWAKVYVKRYFYNSLGLNTSDEVYYILGAVVSPNTKMNYTYTSGAKIAEVKASYWNNASSAWVNSNKTNMYYYNQDSLVQVMSDWKLNIGNWVETSKGILVFSNANNQTIWYDKDASGNWIKSFKVTTFFNTVGVDTLEIQYNWINNNWVNANQYITKLDSFNNKIKQVSQNWYGGWENSIKIENQFDTNNNRLQRDGYSWGSYWLNQSRSYYTYDSNLYIASFIDYIKAGSIWVQDDSTSYDFSVSGNFNESEKFYFYNNGSYTYWLKIEKVQYLYDVSYQSSDLILSYDITSNPDNRVYFKNNMLTYIKSFQSDTNNNWVDKYSRAFHYSPITVGIDSDTPPRKIKIFPNPGSDFILISNLPTASCRVSIISVDGKLITSSEINEFERIDISSFERGVYFVKIVDADGAVYVEKFIKQ